MRSKNTYRVDYEQDETGTWVATIDDNGVSAVSQGRSLSVARKRIREALAAYLDSDAKAESAVLIDDVKLPAPARKLVQRSVEARKRLEQDLQAVLAKTESAATHLANVGMSRRDTAEILGLSYQRIQQLVVRAPNATSKSTGASARGRPRASARKRA